MKLRVLALAALLAPATTIAHESENPALEYRQSLMHLVGANFGPINAMLEGKVPWDAAAVAAYGKDLKAVVDLNVLRGFKPGSEGGDAKPGIWTNFDDFRKKLEAMQLEARKLADVTATGDRAAIEQQFAATGKACKACHDDYREKH